MVELFEVSSEEMEAMTQASPARVGNKSDTVRRLLYPPTPTKSKRTSMLPNTDASPLRLSSRASTIAKTCAHHITYPSANFQK
jgi:hypothetical protein